MRVARPLAHEGAILRLWRAARERRLPHALSFEGREGIGKFEAAKWFAMGCLCERGPGEPCGSCGPCKRVLSGGDGANHPDLFVIDPVLEGEERIKVARIAHRPMLGEAEAPERCLEVFLTLRPLEGGYRPVLIRESHRMNAAAQNALLKTLEEPRPGTLIVLETHRSALLLPTVRSRCVRLRFEAPGREECQRILVEQGIEPEAARDLARMARGSPGCALAGARRGLPAMRAELVAVLQGERSGLSVARRLWELEGEFGGATATARERERLRVALELALALLLDGLRHLAGQAAEELAHGEVVAGLMGRLGEDELCKRVEALLACRVDVEHNLTPASVLERALLVLGEGVPILSG